MKKKVTIASLFDNEPSQWGLRGDPFLWKEMRACFENTPLPSSSAELKKIIETAFESITEKPITEQKHFQVERFSHGGMSSGGIAPDYWRNKAIPLLISRFKKHDRWLLSNAP